MAQLISMNANNEKSPGMCSFHCRAEVRPPETHQCRQRCTHTANEYRCGRDYQSVNLDQPSVPPSMYLHADEREDNTHGADLFPHRSSRSAKSIMNFEARRDTMRLVVSNVRA